MFSGYLIYAACQWGMLIALAKFTDSGQVGQFSLALAITAPVVLLTNLNLRTVQATDTARQVPFQDYLGLRLLTSLLALVVIILLAVAGRYDWRTLEVIIAVGCIKAIESLADLLYGLFQQREYMDKIGRSLILKGVFSLAVLAATTFILHDVLLGVGALMLVWAGLLAVYDLRNAARILALSPSPAEKLWPRWQPSVAAGLVRLALPLGISTSLLSLMANVPNYFLEKYVSTQAVGIFSALDYVVFAGLTVMLAMGQAATPRLARHFADRDLPAFNRLLAGLVGLAVLVGGAAVIVVAAFGAPILAHIYTPEYAAYQSLFLWLTISGAISYVASALSYGLASTRAFDRYIVPYAIVACANGIACQLLIPMYGLIGGAWANLVADVGMCIVPVVLLVIVWRGQLRPQEAQA